MKYKYEVGMRVRDRWDREYLGEVTEVVDEDEIHVKWDRGDNGIGRHDSGEIAPFDPEGDNARAIITQAKIDEATHSLEAAFKALREANALELGSDDYEGAYALKGNPYLDLSKLEDVVESNGWSSSSIYC